MADDILRAAVTHTSQASSHAVTTINTILLKFHRHLYDSFAPTALIEEFDRVLDKVDDEVRKLNASTLEIGARIREKGGSVVDETTESVGRVAPPPSTSPAAAHLKKVSMDGLGSGSTPTHHPVGKPSRPPPLPPDTPLEIGAAGVGGGSGGGSDGGSGGDPTEKVQALLAQLRRKREEFFQSRGETMPPSPPRPLPPPPPPPTSDAKVKAGDSEGGGGTLAELTLLKEERKSLELELLAAHRAIGALEQRLHDK